MVKPCLQPPDDSECSPQSSLPRPRECAVPVLPVTLASLKSPGTAVPFASWACALQWLKMPGVVVLSKILHSVHCNFGRQPGWRGGEKSDHPLIIIKAA